jgi:ubiquinone biosynthesis protein
VVNEAGISWAVPFQRGLMGHARRGWPYTTAEHMRLAMEDLGTTAIKLGQILSTARTSLHPSTSENSKLRDRVPPVAAGDSCNYRARAWRNIDELFAEFEANHAAASIGQVHGAILHDGHGLS